MRASMSISRRTLLKTAVGTAPEFAASLATAADNPEQELSCDVFVYGSQPAAVAAAVKAARRGAKVVLACPKNRPGGMSASGLCTTDVLRRHMFGGVVSE